MTLLMTKYHQSCNNEGLKTVMVVLFHECISHFSPMTSPMNHIDEPTNEPTNEPTSKNSLCYGRVLANYTNSVHVNMVNMSNWPLFLFLCKN